MSDVKLIQSLDDGEIIVEAGVVELSSGLETAVYISLFGGDERDDGSQDNNSKWWGNLLDDDTAFHCTSKTQNLLRSLAPIPANLRRIEQSVEIDLKWLLEKKVASSVDVSASFSGLGRIKITISVKAEGDEQRFEFTENWRATI